MIKSFQCDAYVAKELVVGASQNYMHKSYFSTSTYLESHVALPEK